MGESYNIDIPTAGGLQKTITITAEASSGGGDSGCFIAGTPVYLTSNITKPIEEITVGTKLLSYDNNNQKIVEGEVQSVYMLKHRTDIYDLVLSSGKTITLTGSHPILTIDGWKAINRKTAKIEHNIETTTLEKGDIILTDNNVELIVNDIIARDDLKDITVYNLHIEPYNTYIVEHMIVHNASDNPE